MTKNKNEFTVGRYLINAFFVSALKTQGNCSAIELIVSPKNAVNKPPQWFPKFEKTLANAHNNAKVWNTTLGPQLIGHAQSIVDLCTVITASSTEMLTIASEKGNLAPILKAAIEKIVTQLKTTAMKGSNEINSAFATSQSSVQKFSAALANDEKQLKREEASIFKSEQEVEATVTTIHQEIKALREDLKVDIEDQDIEIAKMVEVAVVFVVKLVITIADEGATLPLIIKGLIKEIIDAVKLAEIEEKIKTTQIKLAKESKSLSKNDALLAWIQTIPPALEDATSDITQNGLIQNGEKLAAWWKSIDAKIEDLSQALQGTDETLCQAVSAFYGKQTLDGVSTLNQDILKIQNILGKISIEIN